MKQRVKGKHIKINPKSIVKEEVPVKKIILSPAQLEEYAELEKEERKIARAYSKLIKEYISLAPNFNNECEGLMTELHMLTPELEKLKLANGYDKSEPSTEVTEKLSELNPRFKELAIRKAEIEQQYAKMYTDYSNAKTDILEKLNNLQEKYKPIKARLEQLKQ